VLSFVYGELVGMPTHDNDIDTDKCNIKGDKVAFILPRDSYCIGHTSHEQASTLYWTTIILNFVWRTCSRTGITGTDAIAFWAQPISGDLVIMILLAVESEYEILLYRTDVLNRLTYLHVINNNIISYNTVIVLYSIVYLYKSARCVPTFWSTINIRHPRKVVDKK